MQEDPARPTARSIEDLYQDLFKKSVPGPCGGNMEEQINTEPESGSGSAHRPHAALNRTVANIEGS